ncbi:MAG TPA: creatininase family protein [Methylomirabilota bacterium]|nr:creatininase family protein [Methylomirabilota bacterium]
MRSRAFALLLCLLLVGASRALAQVPDTVFLEELTWTELRDLIQSRKTTVIVPIGGTEQNGPHMALGKHNVGVMFSERIARALGNALVAPVLAYDGDPSRSSVELGRLGVDAVVVRTVDAVQEFDDASVAPARNA